MIHHKITAHFSNLLSCCLNRIRYLLLARMLRLIRLLMHVKRYRAFVATFLTLIPSLMPYLGIIFCILCIYCSLGEQVRQSIQVLNPVYCSETYFCIQMWIHLWPCCCNSFLKIFGGIVNAGNSKLNSTALYDDEYPFSWLRQENYSL